MAKPGSVLDREEMYEKRALTLRTLGGLFFIQALIVCPFIWMGLRAGSALWLWATIGCGLLGMICYAAAELQHRKAIGMVRFRVDSIEQPLISSTHREAA